jgi:ribokinase
MPRIPGPGETLLGSNFNMGSGGKGSNQAVAIARLGGDVQLIARVGDDIFGREALSLFEREGIDGTHVYMDSHTHTGAAVIFVDEHGQNSIGVAPGANYSLTENDLDDAADLFGTSGVFLTQLEIPISIVGSAIKRAKDRGATVILNPAPACTVPREILEKVDILTPNETEVGILTNRRIGDTEDAIEAARELLESGVGAVVVTLGSKGSVLVTGDSLERFEAYSVTAVDTTGAGDAYNGGLAYGLASGMALEDAIVLASKVAAFSVMSRGVVTGLPTLQDVKDAFGR